MSCGCGCFGKPGGCGDTIAGMASAYGVPATSSSPDACIAIMNGILAKSPEYQWLLQEEQIWRARVAGSGQQTSRPGFGDEGDPPHVDDFWVSQADAVAYAEWLDKRIRSLHKAFLWWKGGADKPQPDNLTIANTAGEWAFTGWSHPGNFVQWVAEVWDPFIKKMREGSWLPFGTTWTRLNSWDVIQKHHREVKAAEKRARAVNLPNVPDMGNPEAKGPLEKTADTIDSVVSTLIWGGVAVGVFLLIQGAQKNKK